MQKGCGEQVLSFFKKKPAAVFEIDDPQLSITPNFHDLEAQLKEMKVDYTVVTEGYITFAGRVFKSDVPLMIGIHFHLSQIEHIEIFRIWNYYRSEEYNISASFTELSGILKRQYGEPARIAAAPNHGLYERWTMPERGYRIEHYLMDRFGPEEHLHIHFMTK